MTAPLSLPVVDTHVEGLPVRVVTGGVDPMPGDTMAARRQWFARHSDDLRTLLMWEPRGNSWMSGAILQPPLRPEADWGVLYIEVTGVLPLCGAGTIAVATVLVESGMVEVTEPVTTVRLDAPIGLITAEVQVRDGRATAVTLTGVPSSVHALDQRIALPGRGEITLDLAFGGNLYAILDAADLGLEVERSASAELVRAGVDVMAAVNAQLPLGDGPACEHAILLAPEADASRARHALVNHPGWMDRSPGGTGTSAQMAVHHARGDLALGEDFLSESLLGTTFTGRLIERTRIQGREAVVPTFTGRAWRTAQGRMLRDPTDPFPAGFTL